MFMSSKRFLKDHVTLKTGVMVLKIQLCITGIILKKKKKWNCSNILQYYCLSWIFDQINALVSIRDSFQKLEILPTPNFISISISMSISLWPSMWMSSAALCQRLVKDVCVCVPSAGRWTLPTVWLILYQRATSLNGLDFVACCSFRDMTNDIHMLNPSDTRTHTHTHTHTHTLAWISFACLKYFTGIPSGISVIIGANPKLSQ